MSGRRDLLGLAFPAFSSWLAEEVGYSQRFHRVSYRQLLVTGRWDPSGLALWREAEAGRPGLIARLEELAYPDQLPEGAEQVAADGTVKHLLRLADGAQVEAVAIPMRQGDRATICVSSQVGCRMGCTFCHTARMGLQRQLAAHEMVGQVVALRRAGGSVQAPRNLVFMGMGEPLDNPEAVRQAVEVLRDVNGLAVAARHLTISTIGREEHLDAWVATGL